MKISQAGDGLRDIRKDRPSFWMTTRCQEPSGNENRRSNHFARATTGGTRSGQVPTGRLKVSVPAEVSGPSICGWAGATGLAPDGLSATSERGLS